jgi:hypothetical protein
MKFPFYIKHHGNIYKVIGQSLVHEQFKIYDLECITNKNSCLISVNRIDPDQIIQYNDQNYKQISIFDLLEKDNK